MTDRIIIVNNKKYYLNLVANLNIIKTRIGILSKKSPYLKYKYVRLIGGRNALWALYIRRW